MDNEKLFHGGKPVEMEINRLIERMQDIQSIINDSDKNPDIYLKEQLFENEFEAVFILNNAYISYGEKALEGFQIDFIQKVFTTLKSTISTTDFSFETLIDENGFYFIQVSTYFSEENIPILNIYPYFKKYEVLENERMLKLRELEKEAEEEVDSYKDRIEFLKDCYKNPALYADGNVKVFLQMNNRKKRDEILGADIMQTNTDLHIANEHLMNIRDEINELNNTLNSISISRDRYTERLRNRYKYSEIKETVMTEENNENTLFNDSLEERESKQFMSKMVEDSMLENQEWIEEPEIEMSFDKEELSLDDEDVFFEFEDSDEDLQLEEEIYDYDQEESIDFSGTNFFN